jgi:hypothetical protein
MVVVCVVVGVVRARREWRFWDSIEPRAPRDDPGFHEQFYRDSDIPPHVSAAVRRVLCTILDLPYEKLEPDDDLQDRLLYVCSLDWSSIFLEVERELGITVLPSDTEDLRPTLGSFIAVVARAYRRQHPR